MIVESVLCVVVLHFCMCWVCVWAVPEHTRHKASNVQRTCTFCVCTATKLSGRRPQRTAQDTHEHSLYVLAVVSPVIIIIIIIDSEYIISYINIVTTTTFLSCPTAVITILIRRRRHHHHHRG